MIFIDSNIPMYLVGSPHPHKTDAQHLIERCLAERARLVTDAEVLQEILHRYVSINCRQAIHPAFDALLGVVDAVFPVHDRNVLRAREIILGRQRISARDALHVAVMEEHHVNRILSFDKDFDDVPGVTRVG